jgi:Glycosyltransferases involved in cell wall biogenesis
MSAHYPTFDTRVGEDDFMSIILPVRNEAAYIVPSLQSMLAQGYDEPHHGRYAP